MMLLLLLWLTYSLSYPWNQILTVADAAGIAVGFGVEITVGWAKKEHHLLGYFPTHLFRAPELTPALTHLQVSHTHTAHPPSASRVLHSCRLPALR